jgi:hypothetical protein
MDIVRPDAVPTGAKPGAGEATKGTEATGEGRSFDQVMSEIDGSKINVHPPEASVPSLQPHDDTRVHALTEEKTRVADSPGGIERLGQEIEGNSVRLRELIGELQSGRSFTSQELIGMQAEMHEITLQIEVTTKVVAETVSGVKHLAQQQG